MDRTHNRPLEANGRSTVNSHLTRKQQRAHGGAARAHKGEDGSCVLDLQLWNYGKEVGGRQDPHPRIQPP